MPVKLTESRLRSVIREQLEKVLGEEVTSEVPGAAKMLRRIKEKFVGPNSIDQTFLTSGVPITVEFNAQQLEWLLSKLGTTDTVESLINADRASRGLKPSRYAYNTQAAAQTGAFGTTAAMDESKKK